jgi:hypothetical protein
MRLYLAVLAASTITVATAMAQTSGGVPLPREDGNRANGRDYQPTPAEVGPREKSAGVRPPAAQQRANNQDLQRIDKNLLRDEGLSTKSVPDLAKGQ